VSGFVSTNPETLLWYEESAEIVLQNVQKVQMALQRGATRYHKRESDLGEEPGRKDKVSVNLSFGSGYTEA
jgi:hypothetical protein